MANHSATAFLLIMSLLVAVVLSGADARLTVRRDVNGGYVVVEQNMVDAATVPELTCNQVHGVQAGETCFSVGQGAGLTLDDFLGFNPNINCKKLFVGQWVCIEATSS